MPDQFNPETAENSEEIEQQFAVKAVQQLGNFNAYRSILTSLQKYIGVFSKELDDDIYEDFLESFPEYSVPDWDGVINEDVMKSPEGKERWREFMMRYENKVYPS